MAKLQTSKKGPKEKRREKGLEEGRDEVEEGKEFEKRRRNSLKRVGKQL